ncbi:MAG: indolepyruvate oxidoreductase subunit beta [Candidatus Omnitrophica bacterium]|nr:indolepyruvate oxidoreductase subunit beta [Candidatus Omnitrophota bacterium]
MNKDKTINVLFCGTGGQGVLKASEVLGQAAIIEGYHVKKSEVHGMAQRGGSVESHLRFGTEVFSPLIPKGEADFLAVFNKEEGARLKNFLKTGGKDLSAILDRPEAFAHGAKFLNTYLLGVLSASLPIAESSWLQAIEEEFRDRSLEENKTAFMQGRKTGDVPQGATPLLANRLK